MARRLEAALNPNAPEIPTPVGADVRLNVFGNEGWELVTILADDDGERVAILKREKR